MREHRSRKTVSHRSGAVLLVSLAVLVLCGACVMQGTQMLAAAHRAQHKKLQIQQAREMVEFGKIYLQQKIAADDKYAGETLSIDFEAFDGSAEQLAAGTVRISKVDSAEHSNQDNPEWRIDVSYPADQQKLSTITASWENKR